MMHARAEEVLRGFTPSWRRSATWRPAMIERSDVLELAPDEGEWHR